MSALPVFPIAGVAAIDHTKLPELYLKARAAMSECHRIDELKSIRDKHSAIAHYAEQAKDKSLLWFAKRIQLRAFERIGEILREFPDYDERKRLAAQHGISIVVANRAYDASHIPARVRSQMIESTPPPSSIRMAESGRGYIPKSSTGGFRRYKDREDRVKSPPEKLADELAGFVKAIYDDVCGYCHDGCGGHYTFAQLAKAVAREDADQYRSILMPLMAALGEFKQNLPRGA
jgi:hypothetical protein